MAISKAMRTYKIDGNPQVDVLYDLFKMWADKAEAIEKAAAEAFTILNKIPEDLKDRTLANSQIQEAHDILDNILHPPTA